MLDCLEEGPAPTAASRRPHRDFNEGSGWTIHDRTPRGQHLSAAATPRWVPLESLAACGNGVLEGLEQCDSGGDNSDGGGCTSSCTVAPGWTCTRTSPSVCTPVPPPAQPRGGDPHVGPASGGGSGGSAPPPHHHRARTGLALVLVLGGVAAAAAAAYAARGAVFERWPAVEVAVASAAAWLGGAEPRFRRRSPSDLPYDDFLSPRPAPARGTYGRLPGEAPPPGGPLLDP